MMLQKRILQLGLFLLVFNVSFAQNTPTRMFIFGHSLIDHRPPATPTPSDETTVPHWLYLLCQKAGKSFSAGGKYGFLPQHAQLPPYSQWGYDIVPEVWESDTEPFSDADINTILITAGNFMQWQAPNLDYVSDPGVSPVSATETIIDWVNQQEDGIHYYIYENWPDMAGFLSNGFPPTKSEFSDYNTYTQGDFHVWWIEYQDFLLQSRPNINIRMIPVGPIMNKILLDLLNDQIPYTDLYEDDAPHGRPNIYFLASLITYMGIYQEKAPSTFNIPNIIHPIIKNNYISIVDFIWSELEAFKDSHGKSRVFYDITSTEHPDLATASIYPNPVSNSFYFDGKSKISEMKIYSLAGVKMMTISDLDVPKMIDISNLSPGVYILEMQTLNGLEWYKMVVE